ncbi:MAG: F0F1 ATP synthase subunit delta [Campylobacteraceae bacterium]|jgi:F-type H+-transporting ATPase subunit delta|nr:F0F1 ATP synthase subunit delta [Campylobacteraceae bacterium]
MSTIIAKRYVKALLDSFKGEELTKVQNILQELSKAFDIAKFTTIISTPDIDKEDKKKLVVSLLKDSDKKLINFISLLSENGRLLLLPDIYKELEFQISLKNNRYEGKIYADKEISKEQAESLQKSFGKKFGADITFKSEKSNYKGVKIEIDDLGVETSFSLERLKAQMTEHILKAI